MKKMVVMISLLVGVLVLFSTVEPCLSQYTSINAPSVRTEFSGCRYRTMQLVGYDSEDTKIAACRQLVNNQEATWMYFVNNPLVDGQWYSWNIEVRRAITAFTMPSGPNVPCDPTKNPPAGYTGVVTGAGIVSGPFMLTPTNAGGGVWIGTFKSVFSSDLNNTYFIEAEGHGGLIEGMVLYAFDKLSAGGDCKCCPAGTVVPANAGPRNVTGYLTWKR